MGLLDWMKRLFGGAPAEPSSLDDLNDELEATPAPPARAPASPAPSAVRAPEAPRPPKKKKKAKEPKPKAAAAPKERPAPSGRKKRKAESADWRFTAPPPPARRPEPPVRKRPRPAKEATEAPGAAPLAASDVATTEAPTSAALLETPATSEMAQAQLTEPAIAAAPVDGPPAADTESADRVPRRNDQDTLAWIVLPKLQAVLDTANTVLADSTADRETLRKAGRQLDQDWARLLPLPEDHAERLTDAHLQCRAALKVRIAALPDPRKLAEEALIAERLAWLAEAEALAQNPAAPDSLNRARAMQAQWKAAGRIPRHAPSDLTARFNAAMDQVYAHRDTVRQERLARLESLAQQAEMLARNPDPIRAAEAVKVLQQRWKEVGGVRGPEGDAVWTRFRAAADTIFEARRATQDAQRQRNIEEREALIAQAHALAAQGVDDPDALIDDLHKKWRRLGPVPKATSDALWSAFRAATHALRQPPPVDAAVMSSPDEGLRFNPFAAWARSNAAEEAPVVEAEAEAVEAPAEALSVEAPALPAPEEGADGEDPTDLVMPARWLQ